VESHLIWILPLNENLHIPILLYGTIIQQLLPPALDGMTSGSSASGIVGMSGSAVPSRGSRENSESGDDSRTSYSDAGCWPVDSVENIDDAYESV